MSRTLLSLILCAFAVPLQAASPVAELICAPSEEMRSRITTQFGQHLASRGIRDPDQTMELWSSPRGDWTLVISYASGRRCIVAMGEHWDQIAPPAS